MSTAAAYGSWRSPITATAIAAGEVPLSQPSIVDGDTYWLEGKPLEGGRIVLVHMSADGSRQELTPAPYNVRTRVHEYGGGAYAIHGSSVYFSNFKDQRLYQQDAGEAPRPITHEPAIPSGERYADACVTHDGRLLMCVREIHASESPDATNELAVLPTDGSAEARTVASGHDFYSSPRISPVQQVSSTSYPIGPVGGTCIATTGAVERSSRWRRWRRNSAVRNGFSAWRCTRFWRTDASRAS